MGGASDGGASDAGSPTAQETLAIEQTATAGTLTAAVALQANGNGSELSKAQVFAREQLSAIRAVRQAAEKLTTIDEGSLPACHRLRVDERRNCMIAAGAIERDIHVD